MKLLAHRVDVNAGNPIVEFPDTGGSYAKHGPGQFITDCDIVFEDYFKNAMQGHGGLMCRANLERVRAGGPYQGHGIIFGSVWRNADGTFNEEAARQVEAPAAGPVMQVQTWGASAIYPGARFLLPATVSPVLHDHTLYRLTISSLLSATFRRYIRYTLYKEAPGKGAYDLFWETGHHYDNNIHFNAAEEALALFDANIEPVKGSYNISIRDLRSAWSGDCTPAPFFCGAGHG